MSRTDTLCADAISSGAILVDAESGRAWSRRFVPAREIGTTNAHGYRVATIHAQGRRAQVKLHRLVWISAYGIPPNAEPLDHINRDRADNRIANLRLSSPLGNAANRRSYLGESNPAAIISRAVAEIMRREHAALKSYRIVAGRHSVSRSLVAQIVRRELWA